MDTLEEIMANSAPGEANDFNTKIIEEFRANEGRVGGPLAGATMILIHHIGAKSGIERVSPLACSPQGDGRFAIVASNRGSPTHPDWCYNLKANPRIKVFWARRCWCRARCRWPWPGGADRHGRKDRVAARSVLFEAELAFERAEDHFDPLAHAQQAPYRPTATVSPHHRPP